MNTSPNRPSPYGVDDRRRGSAHYPQSYDPVDHNRGQASHMRNAGRAVEAPLSQSGQHQQRRPPVTNNAPVNRVTRPPSYPGPPSEEPLDNKTDAAKRQQQRQRGYRRADEPDEEWDQVDANPQPSSRSGPVPTTGAASSSFSNQSLPIARERTNLPPKNAQEAGPRGPAPASPTKPKDSSSSGDAIPRLNSPSVMSSVLQPLDKKVQEYDGQMHEAQGEIAQLDAEMAALQTRRREAESRYMAAKTKHDDYRRQYQGVERALRGEPEVFSRLSFDDERPSTQQTAPLPQSPRANSSRTESWSSLKKSKTGSRFRMSKLFGSD